MAAVGGGLGGALAGGRGTEGSSEAKPSSAVFTSRTASSTLSSSSSSDPTATFHSMNPIPIPSNTSTTSLVAAPGTSSTNYQVSSAISQTSSDVLVATTTTLIGPAATLLRDCPGANNTIVTPDGSSNQFRKGCDFSYHSAGSAGALVINQPVESLDDCIVLCALWNEGNHLSNQLCTAVAWRNNASDQYPGQCLGSRISGTPGVDWGQTECDNALWINAPTD